MAERSVRNILHLRILIKTRIAPHGSCTKVLKGGTMFPAERMLVLKCIAMGKCNCLMVTVWVVHLQKTASLPVHRVHSTRHNVKYLTMDENQA